MFNKLIAALAFFFTVSLFAADISIVVRTSENKGLQYTENLVMLDSLKFEKLSIDGAAESPYMVAYGKGNFKKDSLFSVDNLYSVAFNVSEGSDESMTVSVGSGTLKGEYTYLLNDIDTISVALLDDATDSDDDGMTDLEELFIYGTDPEKHNIPNILGFNVYVNKNGSLEKVGSIDIINGVSSVKMDYIPNQPVVIEALLGEDVKEFTISVKDAPVNVTGVDKRHYRFEIPTLKASELNTFVVKTVSEKGVPTRLPVEIEVPVSFVNVMSLSATSDHQSIKVNFAPTKKDYRVAGYVILRALGSSSADNSALANLSLVSNKAIKDQLPEGVSVVAELNEESLKSYTSVNDGVTVASYPDPMGGPSPYYSYRVVAYAKDNIDGKDVYSYVMTNVGTKSVGKILFMYKAEKFGTKYYNYDPIFAACQADMRVYADIHLKSSGTPKDDDAWYNYWVYNAGDSGNKNSMVWDDVGFNDNKEKKSSLWKGVRSIDVDKDGIEILLANHSDCALSEDDISHKFTISYDSFVKALTGSNISGDPSDDDWFDYTFTFGKGGVYEGDNCQKNCGDQPHAGWKFKFFYRWND